MSHPGYTQYQNMQKDNNDIQPELPQNHTSDTQKINVLYNSPSIKCIYQVRYSLMSSID